MCAVITAKALAGHIIYGLHFVHSDRQRQASRQNVRDLCLSMFALLPAWLWVLLILVGVVYVFGTHTHSYFRKLQLPFKSPLPLVGNFAPFVFRAKSAGDLIRDHYDAFPNERVVGFFEFNNPILFLRDPDMIKQITVKDFDYFTDHRSVVTAAGDPLFGRNLFSLKGVEWRNMRHTLSPVFTSSKMKAMFHLVAECGEQMAEYLSRQSKESQDGMVTLEMKEFYTKYTNDVIATSAFGIHCDTLKQPDSEFYKMGKEASNFGGIRAVIFLGYTVVPKLMEVLGFTLFSGAVSKFFRSLVHSTIATREKEGIVRPDMIHMLMQARKGTLKSDNTDELCDTKATKAELTDDDITAQALLFFLAGFDTSSTLLCFMSHLLAVNLDEQQRVQDEVDSILADHDGKLTYEGIQELKYLDMVINETLRLWPPALASDRRCVRPYVLPATDTSPEIKFKVGESVWVPTFAIHRDARFFDDPEKFDPERFSEENKHKIQPFTYMPFGVGPRICIGQRFALMEAKIAMACILSKFNLRVVKKSPIPLRLNKKTFNMGVEGGFWLGIKPRT